MRANQTRMSRGRAGLYPLLKGIALFDPIVGETCRKNKDAQFLKSRVAQGRKRGTNVGTFVERAAPAVNDQIH